MANQWQLVDSRFRADSNFVYATGCHDHPGAAAWLDTETATLTLMVRVCECVRVCLCVCMRL
jgi:hypothetical protein